MNGLRVGLYGDSFGTGSLPLINGEYDSGINYHWSKLIEQKHKCDITNYAVSGASVYYCYKQFMDTHHLYDRNIFLVTAFGRFNHSIRIKHEDHRIVNLAHLETYFEPHIYLKLSNEERQQLNQVKTWFKLLDEAQDREMCELMTEKVLSVRPDTIMIPCSFWVPRALDFTGKFMFSIYEHQMKRLGLNINKVQENTKWISGHLTPEYNKVFADVLSARIDTGEWGDWTIPDVTFGPNKDEYFISTTN